MRAFLLTLVVLSAPALGQEYKAKDWTWSTSNADYYYAGTVNKAGRMFGQFCYFDSQNCRYLVSSGSSCEPEAEYPILINSDGSAVASNLVCSHQVDGQYVFAFADFDQIDGIAKSGKEIGIALAMESGKFTVLRFSLAGSSYAINEMRTATQKKIDRKTSSTRTDEEVI